MNQKRRKPKQGALRTEVFAMRLDPKMRYLAEIASRIQRRSVANFIEWAIQEALKRQGVDEDADQSRSVWDMAESLWDVNEIERFLKLAKNHPSLLNYEEQMIQHAIKTVSTTKKDEDKVLRCGFTAPNGVVEKWVIAECWEELKAYGAGNLSEQELQNVLKEKDCFSF